jgi:hypothetical protein
MNGACGDIDTACKIKFSNDLKRVSHMRNGEFEAEFKKALARESGAQGGLIDIEKRKAENHCPCL